MIKEYFCFPHAENDRTMAMATTTITQKKKNEEESTPSRNELNVFFFNRMCESNESVFWQRLATKFGFVVFKKKKML